MKSEGQEQHMYIRSSQLYGKNANISRCGFSSSISNTVLTLIFQIAKKLVKILTFCDHSTYSLIALVRFEQLGHFNTRSMKL